MRVYKRIILFALLATILNHAYSPLAYSALLLAEELELSMHTEEYGVRVRRGVEIYITNEQRGGFNETVATVKAWFKPINVDWEEFKVKHYYPKRHLWELDLVDCIEEMFDLWMGYVQVVGQGIDDSRQEVYVIARFYLRDSLSLYISYHVIQFTFTDVFKRRGSGWIDEVRVHSDLKVLSWEPEPTFYNEYEVIWLNPSMENAPDRYSLIIEPLCMVLVVIECLPSDHMVSVIVHGKSAGIIRGGDFDLFASLSEFVFIEIFPEEFSVGLIKYRAASRTYAGSCPGVAKFAFQVDFSNLAISFALLLCLIAGIAFMAGRLTRKGTKSTGEEVALVLEREKLKRELEELKLMIKEHKEVLAKLEQLVKEHSEYLPEREQSIEEGRGSDAIHRD